MEILDASSRAREKHKNQPWLDRYVREAISAVTRGVEDRIEPVTFSFASMLTILQLECRFFKPRPSSDHTFNREYHERECFIISRSEMAFNIFPLLDYQTFLDNLSALDI